MELVKRTAHMTASLSGFAKVKPFEQVFPPPEKKRTTRNVAAFFRRMKRGR